MSVRYHAPKKFRDVLRGRRQRRCPWGFGIAVLFSACLLLVAYLLRDDAGASEVSGLHAAVSKNTQDLLSALQRANDEKTFGAFGGLIECMLQVGKTLENALASAQGNEATTLPAHNDLAPAAEAYRLATMFALEELVPVLRGSGMDALLQDLYHAPEQLWYWLSVVSHALTTVLPEYFLAVDHTDAHTEVLGMGLRFLLQASNAHPALKTKTLPLVDCARYGLDGGWLKFCRNSFANPGGLELRRAAILEELIALHPHYTPLRLHYVVALSLARGAAKADVVVGLIHREQKRMHVDVLHTALLRLCEAFVSPTAASSVSARRQLLESLQIIGTCYHLLRPFYPDNDSWTQQFRGQERPDVMDHLQARRLLDTVESLLQAKDGGGSLPADFRICGGVD